MRFAPKAVKKHLQDFLATENQLVYHCHKRTLDIVLPDSLHRAMLLMINMFPGNPGRVPQVARVIHLSLEG